MKLNSPLHIAVLNNSKEMVEFLLENKAQINRVGEIWQDLKERKNINNGES